MFTDMNVYVSSEANGHGAEGCNLISIREKQDSDFRWKTGCALSKRRPVPSPWIWGWIEQYLTASSLHVPTASGNMHMGPVYVLRWIRVVNVLFCFLLL